MIKDIKPYKQRGETCAIACLMMTMEYYGLMEKANWYDEKRLYKIYKSKYMIGTPFSTITYHLSKNGLNTTLHHSSPNMFDNNKNALSKNLFNLVMDEYKEYIKNATEKGARVINGENINSDVIIYKLQDDNIVIAAGKYGNIFHAILVCGYENDHFIVCDPLYKSKKEMTKEELDRFMDTDIGKWFISVNDKMAN